jgi:hypothetical protein
MSDKKRAKKALPGLLSLVNSFLESKEQGKAAKALRKGVETEVRRRSCAVLTRPGRASQRPVDAFAQVPDARFSSCTVL